MPSYDFECEDGHYTEKFTRIADMPSEVICEHEQDGQKCGKIAPRVFMSARQARDAQPIDPVIVYRKIDGGFIYPGDSKNRDYEGAVRMELRTLGEIRAVAREQDHLDRQHWEMTREAEEAQQGPLRKARRAELMDRLSSNFGKDFARVAIEQNEMRRAGKRFTPGNFFEVTEFDRSNREPQYDSYGKGREA